MDFILNADQKEYTEFIRSHSKGHFLQSAEWSRVKEDWRSVSFLIRDSGIIKGAGNLLIRSLPLIGKNFMYCPRGPVIDYSDKETLQFFVQSVRAVAKKYNAILLKIDPDIKISDQLVVDSLQSFGFNRKSNGLNFDGIQPRFVSRLDISGRVEEILNGFHSKTRYNIRLSEKKGVTIRPGDRKDLQIFSSIMEETGLRNGFVVRNQAYFEKMYDTLVPPGYMRLYIAEYEGKPLSGAICIIFGDKCWYLYGASSNSHRNLMPNYLLQWEMIKKAKEEGCTLYDFRGISGDLDENNPLYGLYRFKKGFNGEYTEFIGEFDLIFDPVLYKLWDVGLPFIKKIRSKIILARKKIRREKVNGEVARG